MVPGGYSQPGGHYDGMHPLNTPPPPQDVVGLYQPRPASAAKPKGQTQPRPTSAPKPTRETGPVNSKEQEDVVKHRKGVNALTPGTHP